MSAEDFRDDVEVAMRKAVAGGASTDEIEGVLEDMQDRVDALRALEGSA